MADKPMAPVLQLRLLGSPQVRQGERVLDIQRRKAQALLFYLAVSGGVHQRATLAALLWPESDEQRAYGSLRRHLSELNRLLGNSWIETAGDTVCFSGDAGAWVDVDEFQGLLAACQGHDHSPDAVCERCIEPLTAAVSLYQADFLTGFTLPDASDFDEWQRFQSDELRFAYATALDRLVEAHLIEQNTAEAIPYARRRLSLDPLHEPGHRQLMRLYAVSGQQAAALRQYEQCAQTLQAELDVPPSFETTALYEQIRRGEFSPSIEAQPTEVEVSRTLRHNLTAATTPFIGRAKELSELLDLCRDPASRLITILGPGGIGKTRLSLEVAARLVDETPDDVFFVRLAQLSDPDHIVPAIANALNFQFQADERDNQEQLFDYLGQKQYHLVLDNFEHLMAGVTLVQNLLQRCSGLRLLVTSRERLKLMGETVFTLNNLDFPTWETPQDLQGYEAVQLFIETVRRIRPTQPLQDDDMQYVVRICRMVGGTPLGIILAAAWVEHLSPETIAAELTQGFDLLETELRDLPERQRSMQTILDYSWRRLTAGEQAVFMRLALFRGGFTRAAAKEVSGASLPILVRLVDKSFLQPGDGERYDLHELLRQYAGQQLKAADAYPTIQQAHATYYLDFLHDCQSRLAGAEQLAVIHQIEADFENIRTAWHWAVGTDNYGLVDHALDGFFRWFWLRRSRQREGLALLDLAYQKWMPNVGRMPQPVWGRILVRMIEQPGPWLREPTAVQKRAEQALIMAQQAEQQAEIAFCHWVLGLAIVSELHNLQLTEEELKAAIQYYEAAVATYRENKDHFWLAQTLECLGHAYRQCERYDLALSFLQESLELRRAHEDRFGLARSYREIAWVQFFQGLETETLAAAQTAYDLQQALGDQQGIADSRFFLALSLLSCGNWQQAKALIRSVQHFAEETDNALYQQWSASILSIGTGIEHTIHHQKSAKFLGPFNNFTARLVSLSFGLRWEKSKSETEIVSRQRNLQKLLRLSTTSLEMAFGLPIAAYQAALADEQQQAVRLLALAFRYPEIAGGWIGHLPEIVALQQSLRDQLPPDEFDALWQQGQSLDLQATVTELLNTDE